MTNTFQVTASEPAPSHATTVHRLLDKASSYLDALQMDTGLVLGPPALRALRLALVTDFIEIHNAAWRLHDDLPDSKDEIANLIC